MGGWDNQAPCRRVTVGEVPTRHHHQKAPRKQRDQLTFRIASLIISIFSELADIRDENDIKIKQTRNGGDERSVETYHGRRRGSRQPSWSRQWKLSWEAC
jgi:hypothetical protein